MPGGGMGEGVQELAGFILLVLLLVFFALAIRTEWDRRNGRSMACWEQVMAKKMKGTPFQKKSRAIGLQPGDTV